MSEHSGNEKSVVWSAVDFAEERQKNEMFCLRFASVERASIPRPTAILPSCLPPSPPCSPASLPAYPITFISIVISGQATHISYQETRAVTKRPSPRT